ncbi:hypothetical protein TYRP_014440 [Tyrophagus putrescentiae]|nr:hypothetical protein TYRP_014440 [Tyrophagus putrescentiae]
MNVSASLSEAEGDINLKHREPTSCGVTETTVGDISCGEVTFVAAAVTCSRSAKNACCGVEHDN